MFIAQEKLENNIAEYIIYMYQIEDLIRAYNFDIDKIRNTVVRPQVKSAALEEEAINWYKAIIAEMKQRKLETTGHCHQVGEVMTELIYLHNTLADVVKDKKYLDLLERATDNIEAFRVKSKLEKNHLIEVCFQALYMKFLLKIQGKEISGESEQAFDTMRIILAYLSNAYHEMKAGDMSRFEVN